jgi:ribose transport system ATP-binding protein
VSTDPGPVDRVVLRLDGVSKHFGAVQALADVSVECVAGEIHAIVGENGSGKSTLLGIASGVLTPDTGTVEIAGKRLHAGAAADALRLGVGMAYQTYAQVRSLSVAENLFLATPRDERPPFREMVEWARSRLVEYDVPVDPEARTDTLNLAQRQFLEVVKALLTKPKALLLDEPTTALGPGEVQHLHQIVLKRAAEGVAVVYVSHRLPEVLAIANRVTVLRDGRSQGTHAASGMSEEDLVSLMIGRPLEQAFPERDGGVGKAVLLEVSGLQGHRFGPVDLVVRQGEIVGIAGAEGNGQHELLRCLAGVERSTGVVRCNGRRVDIRSPFGALRAGIMLLSGDRAGESLFPVLGVRSNATLQVLERFSWAGLVLRRREQAVVNGLIRRLRLKTPSMEQQVRFLSGGNQQKVSLSRPFLRDVHVLLADEPTQGVDVGSRFDIYEALRARADDGVSMIVKSSDPLELAGLCDRVVVISRGRIIDEILAPDLTERRIIEGIVRAKVPDPAAQSPEPVGEAAGG